MPKLLILFINKKKIPWNPCICTMKQKSFYLLKSAVPQLARSHPKCQHGYLVHLGWGRWGSGLTIFNKLIN